jgi:hypothetical protein
MDDAAALFPKSAPASAAEAPRPAPVSSTAAVLFPKSTAEGPAATAENLFPKSAPRAEPEVPKFEPVEPERHGHIPEAIRALRESDTEREQFRAANAYTALLDDLAATARDVPDEYKAVINKEIGEVFADLRFSGDDARLFINTLSGITRPPDEASLRKSEAETYARLVEQHGEGGAKQALALAQKLALRDPRVATLLDASGLGSDLGIVNLFVRLAREERARGRL